MEKIYTSFSVAVLERFMSPREIDAIQEKYVKNLKTRSGMSEPTGEDVRIASHVRKSKSVSVSSRELGISEYQVHRALERVAVYGK